MRPLFFISCVFILFDSLPSWAKQVLWYNPIVHVVGMMRHGFYSTYHGAYVSAGYVLCISAICTAVGLMLLRHHQYSLLNR